MNDERYEQVKIKIFNSKSLFGLEFDGLITK